MAEKTKKSTKQIIDVAHPNKSAPSDNSKSVIVTHRPILKDPMVVGEASTDKAPEKAESPAPSESAPKLAVHETVVEPPKTEAPKEDSSKTKAETDASTKKIDELAAIAAATKADKDEAPEPQTKEETKTDPQPDAEPQDPPKDDASKQAPETASKPAEEEQAKSDDTQPEESSTEQVSDEPKTEKSEPSTPEAEQAQIDQKQAQHDEEIRKLSDSKKYYLPINAVEKRRSKHFVILGVVVSILLALLWIDIALDAAIIKIPAVKPVTHFFSN